MSSHSQQWWRMPLSWKTLLHFICLFLSTAYFKTIGWRGTDWAIGTFYVLCHSEVKDIQLLLVLQNTFTLINEVSVAGCVSGHKVIICLLTSPNAVNVLNAACFMKNTLCWQGDMEVANFLVVPLWHSVIVPTAYVKWTQSANLFQRQHQQGFGCILFARDNMAVWVAFVSVHMPCVWSVLEVRLQLFCDQMTTGVVVWPWAVSGPEWQVLCYL